MTPESFVTAIAGLHFKNSFNPYSDQCTFNDVEGAAKIRSTMLSRLLESAAKTEVDAIWIGRDLGYRGGRRTGLALTDDLHITAHAARWGLVGANRATTGEPIRERTAAVIWRILSHIRQPIFLWNVFPLHPHEATDPFSNRSHTASECRAGEEILQELVSLLRPKRIVAIGNDAARTARRKILGAQVAHVRHPSYGGQQIFMRQIIELYDVKSRQGSVL